MECFTVGGPPPAISTPIRKARRTAHTNPHTNDTTASQIVSALSDSDFFPEDEDEDEESLN